MGCQRRGCVRTDFVGDGSELPGHLATVGAQYNRNSR